MLRQRMLIFLKNVEAFLPIGEVASYCKDRRNRVQLPFFPGLLDKVSFREQLEI